MAVDDARGLAAGNSVVCDAMHCGRFGRHMLQVLSCGIFAPVMCIAAYLSTVLSCWCKLLRWSILGMILHKLASPFLPANPFC